MARVLHTEDNPPKVPGTVFEGPGLTKQSFKDECDINILIERYANGGDHGNGSVPPVFGDFASAPDFMAAQQLVVQAREQFDALPAAVRDRFANDPSRFLEFVGNKENHAEAVKLGIASPPPEVVSPGPVKVEVVNVTPAVPAVK